MFLRDHRLDFSRLPGVTGVSQYNSDRETVTVAIEVWSDFWQWTDAECDALNDAVEGRGLSITRTIAGFGRHDVAESDESECVGLVVPATLEVCDVCRGRARVVNPSVDAMGISDDEFAQNPSFREEYLAGTYNVTCPKCAGARVYPALNTKGAPWVKALAEFLSKKDREDRDEAIEDRHTRAMESGGYDC